MNGKLQMSFADSRWAKQKQRPILPKLPSNRLGRAESQLVALAHDEVAKGQLGLGDVVNRNIPTQIPEIKALNIEKHLCVPPTESPLKSNTKALRKH